MKDLTQVTKKIKEGINEENEGVNIELNVSANTVDTTLWTRQK